MQGSKEKAPTEETGNIIRVFWACLCEWSLSPLGKHLATEWSSVRKAPAILIVTALLGGSGGYWIKTKFVEHEIVEKNTTAVNFNNRISALNIELQDAHRERDKYQVLAIEAENALAPWKQLATSEYPKEPINKSLNLLLEKVDSFQKILKNSKSNPLNEPIASASATATVDVLTDDKPSANMGWGGLVLFASANNEVMLMGTTINNATLPSESGKGRFRIVCDCPVDSPSMGKSVNNLASASYIQIAFRKEIIKPNTKILGGQVIWVINNRITLKFDVPEQVTGPYGNDLSVLFIRSLTDGLSPLIMEPSL